MYPWFGCDFVCDPASGDTCKDTVATGKERILPGENKYSFTGCGTGVDAGPSIGEVYELIPNATQPVQLNAALDYTKHFMWKNGSGGLHEVSKTVHSTLRNGREMSLYFD